MVLREDVSQARAVEIAGLADVLVVFRQVLAEDQVRREVVDALLRLGRAALARLGLRLRGGEVDFVVDGVAGLVQFGVERIHVAVHEVALRDDLVVVRVEFRPARDVALRRLDGQLLGHVAVEVVEALGRHPVARHEDDEAQLRLSVLDGLADRRADDVRPVGGLFELEALVVAREHLLDHVAAEDVRVAHDVLLKRVERLLYVRQVDDGILAASFPVLDADLRPTAAAKTDIDLDAAHLRADELPARKNRVRVFRDEDKLAVGLREKFPVLLGIGVELRSLLREAHAEIVHVAAEAAILDVALYDGREEAERAVHVAHALLQRGGRRALVLGADAVADVVDAEREKAEEELLDRAGVEMARLHVRDARTQRAALAGLPEPLRVRVGNARDAFEHVRVELVPVAD